MIVAYGLVQEGLEAVRNIRDSNWLLGADFKKGGVINIGLKGSEFTFEVRGKKSKSLNLENKKTVLS